MLGFQCLTVKKNERGILLRNGDFDRVLQPGRHWLPTGWSDLQLETFSLEQPVFSHALADYLMAKEPEVIDAEFVRVDLGESELGFRYENGVLVELMPPCTRRLFWKGLNETRIEVLDISEQVELPAELMARLNQTQMRQRPVMGLFGVLTVQVPEHYAGVLHIDGKIEALLKPGVYGFWKFNRQVSVDLLDTRLQLIEVSGQEILTKDKVGIRLNLSATWRYTDVLKACAELQKPTDHLYRELQLGLRAAVGTRTIDELLENKAWIDEVVMAHVRSRLMPNGIELESAGVKDIVLPGDMKTILGRVVEAEKIAQANVIRRREETAATRSLMNTAKVMEDNPIALRMKELETLERVAERIDKISVFGGLDQLLNGLVKLR
jgi:regulator of protease activity HflC (stomatin/prohibitin superfamily)